MTAHEIREQLAKQFGFDDPKDVRCYHCKMWGYNRGLYMNDKGESRCARPRMVQSTTASYQFCRGFDYVGNGGK